MNARRARPSLLVASLAVVTVLSGCGGGDDDASGDEPPAATEGDAAGGACALLAEDDVSDLFGEAAEVVPTGGEGGVSNACLWEAASGDGDFPTRHQLQLSIYEGGGPLDPSVYGGDAEAIEGLGEEAFVVAAGTLGTTAGYREGDRTVIVTYAIVGGEDAPEPSARADDIVALLRSAAERSG